MRSSDRFGVFRFLKYQPLFFVIFFMGLLNDEIALCEAEEIAKFARHRHLKTCASTEVEIRFTWGRLATGLERHRRRGLSRAVE